jgi:long-chain acyl-CoA synthetase
MSSSSEYEVESLYQFLVNSSAKYGNKTAIFIGDDKVSYSQLIYKVDNFASYLNSIGIVAQDRVALYMKNSVEFIVSIFALSKIGAIGVPINTFLKSNEIDYIIQNSGAKAMIVSDSFADTINESDVDKLCEHIIYTNSGAFDFVANEEIKPYNISLDDCAIIIYTSGTTGKPKGAMLSNKNILSNIKSGAKDIQVTSKDRAIVFLPMFHSFTLSIATLLPLYVGGSLVVIPSIRPFSNIFKQTLLKRVTIFMGVPDVYNALAKAKLPWYFMWFNSIRIFVSGAAPLQSKTIETMNQKFKKTKLLEGYGLSEASPAVAINRLDKQKAGSVGIALSGYSIKIVDENLDELPVGKVGEIIVQGDNVMMGYWQNPQASSQAIINGWLLTGDMGYMDSEGFLYIVDRKKDLIISKGINIYPREIEEYIDKFDGVKVSAVVGEILDGIEYPVAYIELEDDIKDIDISQLKIYLKDKVANYKMPKRFHITEQLPVNATGKVLKRLLKQQ